MSLNTIAEHIHINRKTIVVTSLIMLIVFVAVSVLIFFVSLRSAEQVMVPQVIGKDLREVLLELQAKELYPRLQVRYSDTTIEDNIVLEQTPSAGAIVKGGKRINLVVSQHIAAKTVQNYIGENITNIEDSLQELIDKDFSIQIKRPHILQYSEKPSGIILEQEPPAGTPITKNTVFSFVISKGDKQETVKTPELRKASLPALYTIMQKTPLTFSFIETEKNDLNSTIIVKEQGIDPSEEVPVFSTITVSLAIPQNQHNDSVCGILQTTLPEFPYPLTVSLKALYPNGQKEELVSFQHQGGACTIPYNVPKATNLSIEVLNKEIYTMTAGS